jgi:hypothetical protein
MTCCFISSLKTLLMSREPTNTPRGVNVLDFYRWPVLGAPEDFAATFFIARVEGSMRRIADTLQKPRGESYGSTWTHQNQQDHATGIDLFSHPATFGGFRDREGEPMRIPIEQDIWRWVWLGIAILVLTLAIVLAKNAS